MVSLYKLYFLSSYFLLNQTKRFSIPPLFHPQLNTNEGNQNLFYLLTFPSPNQLDHKFLRSFTSMSNARVTSYLTYDADWNYIMSAILYKTIQCFYFLFIYFL